MISEDPVLTELSTLVTRALDRAAFASTLTRVRDSLAAHPAEPQAWAPVPLEVFGAPLPPSVESCWVFVLRAGGVFGAERHPNSHQRTIALEGSALFEVFVEEVWSPRPVDASLSDAPVRSSISIPANSWHRITIGPENFVSCSFHTVPAEKLIEETPVKDDDLTVTLQRLYHA